MAMAGGGWDHEPLWSDSLNSVGVRPTNFLKCLLKQLRSLKPTFMAMVETGRFILRHIMALHGNELIIWTYEATAQAGKIVGSQTIYEIKGY